MIALAVRAAFSGVLIAIIALVARRNSAAGALIASLPLVSLLAMIWLWHDTADPTRLADHAEATFYYVLPSLPMFLLIPAMLRNGAGFWPSIVSGCVLTILLYLLTILIAARFGVRL